MVISLLHIVPQQTDALHVSFHWFLCFLKEKAFQLLPNPGLHLFLNLTTGSEAATTWSHFKSTEDVIITWHQIRAVKGWKWRSDHSCCFVSTIVTNAWRHALSRLQQECFWQHSTSFVATWKFYFLSQHSTLCHVHYSSVIRWSSLIRLTLCQNVVVCTILMADQIKLCQL